MSGKKNPKKNPVVETIKLLDIKIQSQDGSIIIFRVPSDITMKIIFKSYCREKQTTDYDALRLLYDGKLISPKMTLDKLGLKDGDQIDAMMFQTGGGSAN